MKAVIVSMQLAPSSWSLLHTHAGTGASTASSSITTRYHQSSLTKWKQLMLNSGMQNHYHILQWVRRRDSWLKIIDRARPAIYIHSLARETSETF